MPCPPALRDQITSKEPDVTMAYEQPEIIQSMQETLAAVPIPRRPQGEAISSKPLIGPEIRISLSPGMLALLAAPFTVFITMTLGWVALTTLGTNVFVRE